MGQVAEQADVWPVVDDGRGHEDDEGQRDADDVDEERRRKRHRPYSAFGILKKQLVTRLSMPYNRLPNLT